MKWGSYLHAPSYHQFASECLWWVVQKVWGLIPLGGSVFFPCPTLTKETSLYKTCLVWLVWERKTVCFLSFSTWMEWPLYSETEKTVNPRNIYGMLCSQREGQLGKPSVFCHFQHEWSGLFTVKLRKLWTLEILMGCYVFPRRRPIRHKITELQTAIAIKLWFCG